MGERIINEDIQRLKDYRDSVIFYNTNKEAFQKAENSILVDDNVVYFSPLNDISNHINDENLKKILEPNNKGAIAISYIILCIVVIVGIILGIVLRGV